MHQLVHPSTSFDFTFFHHASLPYNPAQIGVTLLASPYGPDPTGLKSNVQNGVEMKAAGSTS